MGANSQNRQITDKGYDRALAVKCINGTFVGKETDGIVSYKGIHTEKESERKIVDWDRTYFLTNYFFI